MADGGSSLFDSIKEFLPVVAGGAIGALAGGGPGALVGAGGASEAEAQQATAGAAQQEKALQALSLIQQRQSELELKQQHEQDWKLEQENMLDFRHQTALWQHATQQEAIAARKDIAAQQSADRRFIADENNSTRMMISNQASADRQDANAIRLQIAEQAKSNTPPSAAEFDAMLKGLPKEQADAMRPLGSSPAGRAQAVKSLGTWAILNSPGIKGNLTDQLINAMKASPGWDDLSSEEQASQIQQVQKMAATMDGRRLKSTIDSIGSAGLKSLTPAAIEKHAATDAKNDATTRSALAADLEKNLKAYDKLSIFQTGVKNPAKRWAFALSHLADKSLAGLSKEQKATAMRSLQHYGANTPDATADNAARLAFPPDRAPAKIEKPTPSIPEGSRLVRDSSGKPVGYTRDGKTMEALP